MLDNWFIMNCFSFLSPQVWVYSLWRLWVLTEFWSSPSRSNSGRPPQFVSLSQLL